MGLKTPDTRLDKIVPPKVSPFPLRHLCICPEEKRVLSTKPAHRLLWCQNRVERSSPLQKRHLSYVPSEAEQSN